MLKTFAMMLFAIGGLRVMDVIWPTTLLPVWVYGCECIVGLVLFTWATR